MRIVKLVYQKKYLQVFHREENNEYMVVNMRKQWEEGHTHIHSYKQAQYLVDCELGKKLPNNVNRYFLVCLKRITKDTKYMEQVDRKLDNIENKDKYYNKPKNFKW